MKDAPLIPIGREVTRVLEALYQELGTETEHTFLTTSHFGFVAFIILC